MRAGNIEVCTVIPAIAPNCMCITIWFKNGVTGLVKGFINPRSGKAFDRKVRFKDDYQRVEFV